MLAVQSYVAVGGLSLDGTGGLTPTDIRQMVALVVLVVLTTVVVFIAVRLYIARRVDSRDGVYPRSNWSWATVVALGICWVAFLWWLSVA